MNNLERAPLLIRSREADYGVRFAATVREALTPAPSQSRDSFVVCDATVATLYGSQLQQLFDSGPAYIVPATEQTKSTVGVGQMVDWLIANDAVRSSLITAVGGGCIQDLVSFVAHVYHRGVSWKYMPTTLLSQADSCIGAKSGINVLPYKNQLGALHAPTEVVVAAEFLDTLPDIEVASGYGEIVKLAVTSSRHFLPFLEESLAEGGLRNSRLLDLSRAALVAKQEIIELDEYEHDLRRVLNYGHSFGHALEAISGHHVPHGLAVLWGIDVINWLGVRWGLTPPSLADRLTALMHANFQYVLPVVPTADELLSMITRDKKMVSGEMNFAVLVDEGQLIIVAKRVDEDLRRSVSEYLETDYVFRRN